jgi:hypothetical protein
MQEKAKTQNGGKIMHKTMEYADKPCKMHIVQIRSQDAKRCK